MNQNDIIISLSSFLYDNFYAVNPASSRKGKQESKSSSSRRMDGEDRPFFRLVNAKHQAQQMGAKGFIDQHIWHIWYYGENEDISRWTADKITQIVNTNKMIQGYLFNHQFSKCAVTGINISGGQMVPGDVVKVSVVANVIEGARGTIASEPVEYEIPEGDNAISIILPKNPTMKTNFRYYDIYAGVDDDDLTLQNTNPIYHGGYSKRYNKLELTLSNVSNTVDVVPDNDMEPKDLIRADLIPFYKIYVMESRVELMQQDNDNKLWDTKIELMTHSRGALLPDTPYGYIKNVIVRGFTDGDKFINTDFDEDGDIVTYLDRGVIDPIVPRRIV